MKSRTHCTVHTFVHIVYISHLFSLFFLVFVFFVVSALRSLDTICIFLKFLKKIVCIHFSKRYTILVYTVYTYYILGRTCLHTRGSEYGRSKRRKIKRSSICTHIVQIKKRNANQKKKWSTVITKENLRECSGRFVCNLTTVFRRRRYICVEKCKTTRQQHTIHVGYIIRMYGALCTNKERKRETK